MSSTGREPPVTDRLDLLHAEKPVGWKGLGPQAVLVGPPDASRSCRVTLEIEEIDATAVVAHACVRNTGEGTLRVRTIRWVPDVSKLGMVSALQFPRELEPFYFATENFRADFFGTGTTRGEYFFKPLPHEMVELGWSEDFVFPGVFIGSGTEQLGLLCAAASQNRFHPFFRLRGGNGSTNWGFEIEERPTGLEWIEVAPGETLLGEKFFFGINDDSDPQQSTDRYYEVLRADGLFAREKVIALPRERIWGSWSYDFFDSITEDDIFRQLPVIKKGFPSVKFVQIDYGYERVYESGQRAQLDFLYETDTPYNMEKFPGGPQKLVREMRAAGLRPATWLGLWVAGSSKLVADHPEWLLLDDMGCPVRLPKRPDDHMGWLGQNVFVLDPSVPGVRDYVDYVCKTVLRDWGFEGVKLDFSSFAFEFKRSRFRYPGRTASEYRRWLGETLRKYLPEDGFFGMCSVAGTGTPLAGPEADYFRCAEDIDRGDWDIAKRIAAWCTNTNMLLQQRPVLPNIDGIGWSKHFDEESWRSWLNLCAVSGMALELAGDLTRLDQSRIHRLNRTLELSDPARRVWCLDVPTGKVEYPPAIWVAQGTDDSLIAVFNWKDETLAVNVERLSTVWSDWPNGFEPVWDDRPAEIGAGSIRLPAHGSVLLRK